MDNNIKINCGSLVFFGIKKRLTAVFFAAIMASIILSALPAYSATLTPRTTEPNLNNPYYLHTSSGGWNGCLKVNDETVLPNCVGYAWGRAYEIMGKEPSLSKKDAQVWYGNTGDGYPRGSVPKLGAIMCWTDLADDGSNGYGHIAVVEEINSLGQVKYSDSAWGGKRFRYSDHWTLPVVGSTTQVSYVYRDDVHRTYTRTFRGYIYIGKFD